MIAEAVLGYIFGVISVILSFYFYPKLRQERRPEVKDIVRDDKEEKLKEQWDNLLNYDGNKKE